MQLFHPVSGKYKNREPEDENGIIDDQGKQQKTTPNIEIHHNSPLGAADALKITDLIWENEGLICIMLELNLGLSF